MMLHLKAEFRTKQTHDGTLMHVKRDSFQCLATVGPGQKQGRAGITKIRWKWWSERSQKKALTWGQRDKGRERQLVWQGGSITFGSWIPADPWVRRGIKIKMENTRKTCLIYVSNCFEQFMLHLHPISIYFPVVLIALRNTPWPVI